MRFELNIPDPLFDEAQRAAVASGLSVERFVADALELHLLDDLAEQPYLPLTDQQLEIVDKAEADIDAGRFITAAQMREHFRQKS